MATDAELGELLVRENLMTATQLKTARDFQQQLGGDLRSIVVKLGYVKDSVLAGLVAQEDRVETTAAEITGDVIDWDMVKAISPEILEKHQVLPLVGDNPNALVLAMSDPNNLAAIELIQFRVNRSVEPAVTTKNAIRRALNQLRELKKQAAGGGKKGRKGALPPERLKQLRETPVDKLMRAYIVLQIEKGELSVEDLLTRANKL